MKLAVDVVPSVAATVLGAYIVNHYITAKPAAPTAAVSRAVTDTKPDPKPADKPADTSSQPQTGVNAKAPVIEKPAEKSADLKPADTVVESSEQRHHPHEKAVAKATPVPPAAAPGTNPESAVTPEERRAANDLARAAIERLRLNDGAPRTQGPVRSDASRASDVARAPDASRAGPAAAPALLPLPPPIMVSAPPSENVIDQNSPRTTASVDPSRPTPPADIPGAVQAPLDLRADVVAVSPVPERRNIGDDMLSAAKSMFHAVIPK